MVQIAAYILYFDGQFTLYHVTYQSYVNALMTMCARFVIDLQLHVCLSLSEAGTTSLSLHPIHTHTHTHTRTHMQPSHLPCLSTSHATHIPARAIHPSMALDALSVYLSRPSPPPPAPLAPPLSLLAPARECCCCCVLPCSLQNTSQQRWKPCARKGPPMPRSGWSASRRRRARVAFEGRASWSRCCSHEGTGPPPWIMRMAAAKGWPSLSPSPSWSLRHLKGVSQLMPWADTGRDSGPRACCMPPSYHSCS